MKKIALLAILLFAFNAHAKTVEIKMLNMGKDGPMSFEPGFVKLDPGDTVKFIPTDMAHNTASAIVPTGATTWSGLPDKEVTVTFDKEGVYIYKCVPHLPMAMVGVIQVGQPTNLDAAKKEAQSVSAGFVMNKDRLSKYLSQVR